MSKVNGSAYPALRRGLAGVRAVAAHALLISSAAALMLPPGTFGGLVLSEPAGEAVIPQRRRLALARSRDNQ